MDEIFEAASNDELKIILKCFIDKIMVDKVKETITYYFYKIPELNITEHNTPINPEKDCEFEVLRI